MFKWLRKFKKEKEPLSRNGKSNAIAFQNVLKDPEFYHLKPGQRVDVSGDPSNFENLKPKIHRHEDPTRNGCWEETIMYTRLAGPITLSKIFVSHLVWCPDDCKQFHPTFKPRMKEEYERDKAEEEKNQAEFLDTLVEAYDKVYTGWEAAFKEIEDLQPHEEKK